MATGNDFLKSPIHLLKVARLIKFSFYAYYLF